MENDQSQDVARPVAYDANGKPLYATPEEAESARPARPVAPTVVHMSRPLEPLNEFIPPELQKKHDMSVQAYPKLDLSEHEYVVLCVRRHLIGLLGPIIAAAVLMCLVLTFIILLPDIMSAYGAAQSVSGSLLLGGVSIAALVVGGAYMVYWVYVNNTFFLTNESIIEKTQTTLFSSNVKSVSLADVVDVSYQQVGLFQTMLNYGTVQVGTKDDEVPYVFHYVRQPKSQASLIKDAVTSYKNGRGFGGAVDIIQ